MDAELITLILSTLTATIGGVVGWFTAKRSKDNVYLQEQLASVNLLLENNKMIMGQYTESQERIVTLSSENARLQEVIRTMELEIKKLTRKNEDNNRKIADLQRKLNTLFGEEGDEK